MKAKKIILIISVIFIILCSCFGIFSYVKELNYYQIQNYTMNMKVTDNENENVAHITKLIDSNDLFIYEYISYPLDKISNLKIMQNNVVLEQNTYNPNSMEVPDDSYIILNSTSGFSINIKLSKQMPIVIEYDINDFMQNYESCAYFSYSLYDYYYDYSKIKNYEANIVFVGDKIDQKQISSYLLCQNFNLFANTVAKYEYEDNTIKVNASNLNNYITLNLNSIISQEQYVNLSDNTSNTKDTLNKYNIEFLDKVNKVNKNYKVRFIVSSVIIILLSCYLILYYLLNIIYIIIELINNSKKQKYKKLRKQRKDSKTQKQINITGAIKQLNGLDVLDIYSIYKTRNILSIKQKINYVDMLLFSLFQDGAIKIENEKIILQKEKLGKFDQDLFLKYLRTIKNASIKAKKDFTLKYLIKYMTYNPNTLKEILTKIQTKQIEEFAKEGIIDKQTYITVSKLNNKDNKKMQFIALIIAICFIVCNSDFTLFFIFSAFCLYLLNILLLKILNKGVDFFTDYGKTLKRDLDFIYDFKLDSNDKDENIKKNDEENKQNNKENKQKDDKQKDELIKKIKNIQILLIISNSKINSLFSISNSLYGISKKELASFNRAIKRIFKF